MEYDGILFDLDGTLWDATAQIAQAWNEVIAGAREDLLPYGKGEPLRPEDSRALCGKTMDEITDLLFGDFPGKEGLADRCYSHENDYLRLHPGVIYPGVGEALRTLSAHLPLAVVSNCQAGYIEVFLEASGFGAYFAGHLGFGDTGLPKWENIRLMCERLGLRHPIYVGDTQGDADAAARVGIPFAHARYGFGTVRRADRVIASPAELPSLCAAAAGGTPETPLPGGRKGGIWQKSTL